MDIETNSALGNIYVDLDALPAYLNLAVGQNLIFVRAFSASGNALLTSLVLPQSNFISARVDYGTQFPDQPQGTYVAGLALVNAVGVGEILIQFKPRCDCNLPLRNVRLPFTVSN